MLSKNFRLNLRLEKVRFQNIGHARHSPFFTVISIPAAQDHPRFAIITSTKFHPHSVKRHAAKRIIAQIIQERLSQINSRGDYLIIPKRPLLVTDRKTLTSDLLKLLSV